MLRRLVRYGMNSVSALQAATLNAAVRIGRQDLGLLAPGKRADIAVFSDLQSFEAVNTIVNGTPIVADGKLTVAIADVIPPDALLDTMKTDTYTSDGFRVSTTGSSAEVVVIEQPRFTHWGKRQLPVVNGAVQCTSDLTRMAVINPGCLLYTSPSPRDRQKSRMPSSA